jgi:hypothetical protein
MNRWLSCLIIPILAAVRLTDAGVTPLGTDFTYQGRLRQSGDVVNSSADLQFRLWDAAAGGSAVSSIQQPTNVAIVDGLFTVPIDFLNNVWDGSERWLEIAVRVPHDPGNSLPFTTLTPRQAVTATPYALQTRGLYVNAGGSLGVGTNAPLSRLTVNGDLTFLDDSDTIRWPATSGATEPMIEMFDSGSSNADRMVVAHSPAFDTWGLRYSDVGDDFQFVSAGAPKFTVDLTQGDLTLSDDQASINFPAADAANSPMIHMFPGAGNAARMVLAHSPTFADWGLHYSDDLDRFSFAAGGLTTMSIGLSPTLGAGFVGVSGDFSVSFGDTHLGGPLTVETGSAPAVTLNIGGVPGATQHLMSFQRNDVEEGSITIQFGNVSYNAFTGSHYGWTDQSIEYGALVVMTGDNRRADPGAEHSEIVYGIGPSSRANDPRCLGAYLGRAAPSSSESGSGHHLVMAAGNGEMWVAPGFDGANIEPGDYLISSETPGCAMKDDPQHFATGYIVARAAEPVDWSAVEPNPAGIRRAKISVLFESFVRDTSQAMRLAQRVAELEAEVRSLRAMTGQLERLENLLQRAEANRQLVRKENPK